MIIITMIIIYKYNNNNDYNDYNNDDNNNDNNDNNKIKVKIARNSYKS